MIKDITLGEDNAKINTFNHLGSSLQAYCLKLEAIPVKGIVREAVCKWE